MIIYIITEDSKCSKSSVFLLKKSGFANEARFGPSTNNFYHKLKIACYNLSFFI